jgi:hypothetical protein
MLCLPRRPGRLRGWRHGMLVVMALPGAWVCLGASGVVLLALWGWRSRPQSASGLWRLPLAQLRWVRLGRWRTVLGFTRGAPLEIFHDEISAAELARLRRLARWSLSAGGGLEHVEPV